MHAAVPMPRCRPALTGAHRTKQHNLFLFLGHCHWGIARSLNSAGRWCDGMLTPRARTQATQRGESHGRRSRRQEFPCMGRFESNRRFSSDRYRRSVRALVRALVFVSFWYRKFRKRAKFLYARFPVTTTFSFKVAWRSLAIAVPLPLDQV